MCVPFDLPGPASRDVVLEPPPPVLVVFLHVRDRVLALPLASIDAARRSVSAAAVAVD